jgi:hypothetical protein
MAKTFNYGAGIWATKTGSSMAYNDQNDNYKPTPFSVTRDSIATRVNKQGLIEVVGKDKLRIDYTDSSNGVALLEPSRTNLITYSEDFSNASWNKESGNQVINSNVETSPSNTLTADKLTVSSGSITTRKLWYQQSTTIGSEYTFSVYVKSVTGQVNTGFMSIAYLDANINETSFTATDIWQRVVVTATANDTVTRFLITGDPNCQIYIWGAMIEQGSYATSYIPTSGSTVPRAADVANGAGNEQVFNDSEGVLFVNTAALANDLTNRYILLGTSSNNVYIRYQSSSNSLRCNVTVNGSSQFIAIVTLDDETIYSKISVKYKENDFNLYVNGFKLKTDLGGSTFTDGTLTELAFDNGISNALPFYGKVKEIGYYDTALTDAELEALTSYTSFTNMANELNLTIK